MAGGRLAKPATEAAKTSTRAQREQLCDEESGVQEPRVVLGFHDGRDFGWKKAEVVFGGGRIHAGVFGTGSGAADESEGCGDDPDVAGSEARQAGSDSLGQRAGVIARAVQRWLAVRKVGPLYIAPGSPWENGYSESFNSRMKAEFADREVFGSLVEAKVLGAEYQRYWNQERLHSGIGYQTPAEFAAELGPDSAALRPPQVQSTQQPTLINTGT